MKRPLSQALCVRTGWESFGIPSASGDGFSYNMEGRLSEAARCVTAGTVMQLSAAWACVTLLSDTISTLPLGFYRKTSAGRLVAEQHPLYRVLRRQPNAVMTSAQFIGATVASLLLWGNSYAEKLVNAGQVIGLNFLRPDRVSRQAKGLDWEWIYTDLRGKRRVIPKDRMMHIPAFSTDGICGLSPIRYGSGVFGAAHSAQDAANATFQNGLHKTTYFKYPTTLKEAQRSEAREAIATISGAVNAGKNVILEAGMEAGEIGINPADAQLLESRAYSTEEICSWFRVQPFMIGRASQGQTNWGTGIEQQMIGFITFTLRPWLSRIEQAITKDLLRPEEREEYYAEFNLEGLLRGDSKARAEFYSSALQNGWMNRTIVARLENLPPPPDGDVYTVQANLIPLDQLGQDNPGDKARAAVAAWLRESLQE